MNQALKYFDFDQNNSGGTFDFDADKGISTKVIIQARDAEEANYLATRIGLYFDGYGDCSCCGDRWYRAYGEGTEQPAIHGGSIQDWMTGPYFTKWMAPDRPEVFVHRYDGAFIGLVYGDKGNLRLTEHLEVEG